MNWILKSLPVVALAIIAATPASAATKHMRHHTTHHRAMTNAYGYGPAGPPQRPVYSAVNGKMIGRSDDPNIAYQMQNDDAQMYR
jgi:hypothetical protein